MAVKTKEELLNAVQGLENVDEDASLSLIEDITDTFDSFSNAEDWKTKYEENDAAWKKKYRDRFFNSASESKDEEDEEEQRSYTFEALFKTT